MEHDIRPCGQYWVLEDASTHKVKRILVESKEAFVLPIQPPPFRSLDYCIRCGAHHFG